VSGLEETSAAETENMVVNVLTNRLFHLQCACFLATSKSSLSSRTLQQLVFPILETNPGSVEDSFS